MGFCVASPAQLQHKPPFLWQNEKKKIARRIEFMNVFTLDSNTTIEIRQEMHVAFRHAIAVSQNIMSIPPESKFILYIRDQQF